MSSNGSSPQPGPVTDSPWFWLGLFSLAAVLALATIGPKFQRRQARLELQSQVREQVWRERLAPSTSLGTTAADAEAAAVDTRLSGADLLLWPLGVLATLVTIGCWAMLWRECRGLPAGQTQPKSP